MRELLRRLDKLEELATPPSFPLLRIVWHVVRPSESGPVFVPTKAYEPRNSGATLSRREGESAEAFEARALEHFGGVIVLA